MPGSFAPQQGDTSIGHVHLKVGNIKTAEEFYANTLGFNITSRYGPQALFVSAGGYHHHIGLNTWYSEGAGLRTPALGLSETRLHIPDAESMEALKYRLKANNVQYTQTDEATFFADPWDNRICATLPIL